MTAEVVHHGADVLGLDAGGAVGARGFESEFGEPVDFAGHTAAFCGELRFGGGAKDVAGGVTCDPEAMPQIRGAVVGLHAGQVKTEADPLLQRGMGVNVAADLGLAHQQKSHAGAAVVVEVQNAFQIRQRIGAQILRLVEHENDVPLLAVVQFFENETHEVVDLPGGPGAPGFLNQARSVGELPRVVGETKVRVLEKDHGESRGIQRGGEDPARDRFAAPDFAAEQSGIHGALFHEVAHAGEGLLMLARLEEKPPVGEKFESPLAERPVFEERFHEVGWRAGQARW